MEPTGTVLSHLAMRFAAHPEVIATEALAFTLHRSAAVRLALSALAASLARSGADELTYRTQAASEDGSRPDLVGTDPNGSIRIVLEAKFWAGLTEAQPVTYLRSLGERNGLLLFVAPGQRLGTLWGELLRRCHSAGLRCGQEATPGPDQRCVSVGDGTLALASWRVLLDRLREAAETASDSACVADIRQLAGLCEQMDTEAFLPLCSEELTGPLGRRVIQFGDLANDLTDMLVASGAATVKGLRSAATNGGYGRYLLLRGQGAFLGFSARHWAAHGESPLWLTVKGSNWQPSEKVRQALTSASIAYRDVDGACGFPVLLPTGVEREAVIEAALAQLGRVAAALSEVGVEDQTGAGPPPEVSETVDDGEQPGGAP